MRFVGNTAVAVATIIILCAALAGCATQKTASTEDDADKVAVGYGEQDADDITGSVSTVDVEKAMKDEPTTNVADMLRGRIAGVIVSEAPGGGIQVRIRGATSLMGSNEPLYVVDGMPVEADRNGTLSHVNPRDVESISVLKDASATAIYGTRGANGVIIIKTKRQ
jgi:TonB-dependent SusC/RagA subfamily outer membrane receptor